MKSWLHIAVAFIGLITIFVTFFLGYNVLGFHTLFGIIIPYLAIVLFIVGILFRIFKWASIPVLFHIPTICGQQKSLPWITANNLDSPHNVAGVIKRMALEILFFRSLFLNEKFKLNDKKNLEFGGGKLLWLGAILFHWSFLIILLRHMRLFTEPVPSFINFLRTLDGLFQWTWWPGLFITDVLLLIALTYLFFRRVLQPQLRFISLSVDYFPLLLIIGVATTGVCMRLFMEVDIVKVKELAIGLITLKPPVLDGSIGWLFYLHLFFVCILIAYLPYSKLIHGIGIFLSPTRNLINNSRMVRHINPLNNPVKVHTYEEWEDEFKDQIKKAGLTFDKE